jgi:hypothetical protein
MMMRLISEEGMRMRTMLKRKKKLTLSSTMLFMK